VQPASTQAAISTLTREPVVTRPTSGADPKTPKKMGHDGSQVKLELPSARQGARERGGKHAGSARSLER
jgi:hypothetical protein